MTITENRPEVEDATEAVQPVRRPAPPPSGLAGWVMTADHKRVGRLYIIGGLLGIAAALVVGALLAVERVDATAAQLLELDSVLQLLSLYRFGLVFLGVLPLLVGLAVAIVPLQVGAHRIAFGRAVAMSFWGWLIGAGLLIASYAANGGPGGGNSEAVDLFLLALAMVVVSLLLAVTCVVATALALRAPGMTLGRMPILAWGAFVSGIMLLISLPVLVGNLIFLYVDHHYARLVFGGNVGLPVWIEWSISQPQTYLYALIGLGAIGDIVPVMSRVRQPLRFTVLGALGVAAALSFGGYIQPALNRDVREELVFVATNVVAFVPVLALLGLWGLALRSGKPRLASALFFALGAGLMALIGAAAGALPPIEALDLFGTQYELGQYNFVLLAGALAGLGGIVFWGPKLWGRRLPGRSARLLAVLGAIGVLLVAAPDLLLGFLDQPLGEVNFELDQEGLGNVANAVSFIGYVVVFLVLLGFLALALRSFAGKGQAVDGDPWDGQTLEWTTSSPPPPDNFPSFVGEVGSPEPLLDRKEAAA